METGNTNEETGTLRTMTSISPGTFGGTSFAVIPLTEDGHYCITAFLMVSTVADTCGMICKVRG